MIIYGRTNFTIESIYIHTVYTIYIYTISIMWPFGLFHVADWHLAALISSQLADRDADGLLVFQEFAMAMAMVARRRRGWPLPASLPAALVRSVESFGGHGSHGSHGMNGSSGSHLKESLAQIRPIFHRFFIENASMSTGRKGVESSRLEGYRAIFQRLERNGLADLAATKVLTSSKGIHAMITPLRHLLSPY